MLKYTILLSFYALSCVGQDVTQATLGQPLVMVWYNLENAFDTIDDPGVMDEEYLPSSPKSWDRIKYWSKLNRLAKVIRNASGFEPPAVIGVCEVENANVLYQLSTRSALKDVGYRVVHYDSPDKRGIDVGMLYDPSRVSIFDSEAIPVLLRDGYPTRDILISTGILGSGDTIHIVLNHWPSRRGGQRASEWKRCTAARTASREIGNLLAKYPSSTAFITGDFNDAPEDKSVSILCDSMSTYFETECHMRSLEEGTGTHAHAGHWAYLDQWITIRNRGTTTPAIDSVYVYKRPYLLKSNISSPGFTVKRSWMGNFFTSGYSDHLPIVLILNTDSR